MKLIQGVVNRVNKKDWNGSTLYSFTLNNSDTWYRLGDVTPQFKEGDQIEFEEKVVGQNHYVNQAPRVITEGAVVTAPPVRNQPFRKGGFSGGGGGFKGGKSEEEKAYWGNRDAKEITTQRRIEIQAARNASIEWLKVILPLNVLKLPKKEADTLAALNAYLDEFTSDFIANNDRRLAGVETPNAVVDDKANAAEAPTIPAVVGGDWE